MAIVCHLVVLIPISLQTIAFARKIIILLMDLVKNVQQEQLIVIKEDDVFLFVEIMPIISTKIKDAIAMMGIILSIETEILGVENVRVVKSMMKIQKLVLENAHSMKFKQAMDVHVKVAIIE